MFRGSTRDSIIRLYNKFGLKQTLGICKEMLSCDVHKKNKTFLADVHGEICESVLECMIIDFMKKNPKSTKDWFYSKGMILKDINNSKGKFLAELDFTLFTPKKIYSFECKSFGGEKVLKDEGKVYRNGKFYKDVFKQHYNHFKVLSGNLERFRDIKETHECYKPFTIAYFDFSLGEFKDERDKKWKNAFPLYNMYNLYSVFKNYNKIPDYWNIEFVRKAVEIIDKNKETNTDVHLDYVKSLHGKKRSSGKRR